MFVIIVEVPTYYYHLFKEYWDGLSKDIQFNANYSIDWPTFMFHYNVRYYTNHLKEINSKRDSN